MADTAIEWTERVWNPSTGCDRVSPGCDNCYALTMAKRLKGMGSAKYQTDGDPRTSGPGFGLAVHSDALTLPLRWRKPQRIFVNSMSDLFHDKVPDEFIAEVLAVAACAPQHTFQVLTKRHARMRSLLNSEPFHGLVADLAPMYGRDPDAAQDYVTSTWPLPNVHLVVSVENQQWADIRIPALLDTPAAVRGVSMEPLLGPVDLRGTSGDWLGSHGPSCSCLGCWNVRAGSVAEPVWWGQSHPLSWVVLGGESGPGARPMDLAWAQQIVGDCQATGVPVFVKQLGSRWGRNHHDIDAFPDGLRVREYPKAVARG